MRIPTRLLAVARWLFALVVPAVAVGLTLLVAPLVDPIPTPPFVAAVLIVAWVSGFRPALLTIAVSGAALNYYFLPPLHAWAGHLRDDLRRHRLVGRQPGPVAPAGGGERAAPALRDGRRAGAAVLRRRRRPLPLRQSSLRRALRLHAGDHRRAWGGRGRRSHPVRDDRAAPARRAGRASGDVRDERPRCRRHRAAAAGRLRAGRRRRHGPGPGGGDHRRHRAQARRGRACAAAPRRAGATA